jgi:hypothetical protein
LIWKKKAEKKTLFTLAAMILMKMFCRIKKILTFASQSSRLGILKTSYAKALEGAMRK